MKKFLNYYDLLGVEPNASKEEILNAFKEKAKEYHPDKNNNNSTSTILFQYILEAKEVLIDDKKRLEYDYKSGFKERPVPHKNKLNFGTTIFVSLLALIIGIFIGQSKN